MSYTVVKPRQPLEPGHFIFVADNAESIRDAYLAAHDYGLIIREFAVAKQYYLINQGIKIHTIPHNNDRHIWHYERLLNDGQ
jgi:hypothetical protein